MPNGEILPAGLGITWTRARPCSNLFDRVSYFSARPRPARKKSFFPRRDAALCFKVLLTSSSRRGRSAGGRAETREALIAPDTYGRLGRVPGNLIIIPPPSRPGLLSRAFPAFRLRDC